MNNFSIDVNFCSFWFTQLLSWSYQKWIMFFIVHFSLFWSIHDFMSTVKFSSFWMVSFSSIIDDPTYDFFQRVIICITMDVDTNWHNFLNSASIHRVKHWTCTWPLRHRKSQWSGGRVSRAHIHLQTSRSQILIIPSKGCFRYPKLIMQHI